MNKSTLTDLTVRALKAPVTGQVTHWDNAIPGLGVRISQGGTKTFVLVHGRDRRRETLGRYGVINLSEARTEAKRILAEKTLGLRQAASTIASKDAVAAFLDAARQRNRPRTVKDYSYHLNRHFLPYFANLALSEVKTEAVSKRLNALEETPGEQNHAYAVIRVFFKWAVRRRYLTRNPIEGMQMPAKLSSRDRVLSDDELATVCKKAFKLGDTYARILALLICTGQRRGEIAALEWSWIDLNERHVTLPSRISKNKREHRFPIGARAKAIIESTPRMNGCTYLFPAARSHVRDLPTTIFNGWGKSFPRFAKDLDVAPFTLHDFRRTISSKMAELGVSQTVVEKLLNHVSGGTQSPIAQVYNRYNFMSEMRDAINRYEAHLAKLVSAC